MPSRWSISETTLRERLVPEESEKNRNRILQGREEVKNEFLKWFTQAQRNTAYSVVSGYLPVTKEANSADALKAVDADISPLQRQVLEVAMDTARGNQLYTPHAFANASAVRSVLEYGLKDLAAADRATVEERLAQGLSLPEAAAEFLMLPLS